MALVLKKMYKGYFWIFNELADPRSNEYFLLSTPLIPILICTSYLYISYQLGPRLMQDRKPFQLKNVLVLYNLSQIIFNLYMAFEGIEIVKNMNLKCNLVDYSQSTKGKQALQIVYYFHLLKIYDLLDTIFMILKKNTRQITFLHVYHHFGMAFVTFLAAKFIPGGELVWTGFMNVIVHSIMYMYYLLAALDSKWKSNILIKKFLTLIQLLQFIANVLIYGRLWFQPDCPIPGIVPLFYVPQNVFMFTLFADFYIKTYVIKKPKK